MSKTEQVAEATEKKLTWVEQWEAFTFSEFYSETAASATDFLQNTVGIDITVDPSIILIMVIIICFWLANLILTMTIDGY